tara:strand:+ start:743 stop:1690 length:948 start_codon:yes stop_codon:yes gene_type:complete
MRTEQYIEELLYRYNCVILPGFGAFLTQKISAELQENSNTFSPPSKVVSFNQQLQSNDGLLVNYMATAEKYSYEEALATVTTEIQYWNRMLTLGQRIKFANIGELFLNAEQKIQFIPASQINYLTTSFGLSPVVATPIVREVLKEEILALEEEIPFIITPEQRKKSVFRPYLKYAAVALLAISTGLTGLRYYDAAKSKEQVVRQEVQQQVSKHIQEATFFNTAPLELPSLSLDIITKAEENVHHIIAGAFRVEVNATKKINELKAKGYNASYVGVNKYGLHQVAFASFTDVKEGLKFLKEIKSTESSDAWMLSPK